MEYGVSSSNGFSSSERSRPDNPLSTRHIIEASDKSSPGKNNSSSSQLHVGFSEEKGEVKEKRERFLTAKYGVSTAASMFKHHKRKVQANTLELHHNNMVCFCYIQAHQMALIRKRLAVEMWIYEQLNELYGCTVSYIYLPLLLLT